MSYPKPKPIRAPDGKHDLIPVGAHLLRVIPAPRLELAAYVCDHCGRREYTQHAFKHCRCKGDPV